jgi:peptidoglycan biosynthesis protein MviN/MurJ (putative lipid II flippase)
LPIRQVFRRSCGGLPWECWSSSVDVPPPYSAGFFVNAPLNAFFFLPGQPELWAVMTLVSLYNMTILAWAVEKGYRPGWKLKLALPLPLLLVILVVMVQDLATQ